MNYDTMRNTQSTRCERIYKLLGAEPDRQAGNCAIGALQRKDRKEIKY